MRTAGRGATIAAGTAVLFGGEAAPLRAGLLAGGSSTGGGGVASRTSNIFSGSANIGTTATFRPAISA